MSGEHIQNESRTAEHRAKDRPAGAHDESGSQARSKNRRSGGNRKGAYRFEDQMEHDICQLVTHRAPQGFPAINRSELATRPPMEVARSESRILLCDGMHEGPHLWPNGDEVE